MPIDIPSGDYSLKGVHAKAVNNKDIKLIMRLVGKCYRDAKSNQINLVPLRSGDEIRITLPVHKFKYLFKNILNTQDLTDSNTEFYLNNFSSLTFEAKIDANKEITKVWITEPPFAPSEEESEQLRSLL
ncbi:TPA: hypothetical protein ACY3ID_004430 [Citrobacter amalonaticus]|uniref:hypothetical protein n=1 Tax=Citrobacter amalonaticus TaxID=35703 RepID=UPI0004D656BA|nr:hypothetical protein [Citrobacter amalonaticus]KEY46638.1 hypothetical protein DQ02_13805 [Citrobacter amalonaticus]HDZ8013269.1 hypothetical protein [Citrobacter amalonaticus]